MDIELLNQVRSATPDLNSRVCRGIATDQLKGVEPYIDKIFQEAAKNFPEGLEYKGYRRISPTEEFNIVTKDRDGKSTYELARSDFYYVAYEFTYQGEKLYPRYIQLPFADTGGIIHVRGNAFSISPVLADPTFSIGAKNMYIALTRAKLTFERTVHHFYTNHSKQRETTYVVWSWVHSIARQRWQRRGTQRVIYSTLVHYLFAKYGVTKAFSEFAGADIVLGDENTITEDNYPKSKWVICASIGVKPKAIVDSNWKSTQLRIAVPKKQYNDAVVSLVGGFFYVVDHFSNRFRLEDLDDMWPWKSALGRIIYGPGMSDGLIVNEVDEHLISLDEYVDALVWEDLRQGGVECDNIYELFMYVIDTLSKHTVNNDASISSMYEKRLMTLRFLMLEIVSQINTLMYKLRGAKKKRDTLSADEINNLMNKFLRPNKIVGLSNHAIHPEVTSINTSSDNMFFGVTNSVLSQESASNAGSKKDKINLRDPAKHLHVSLAEVGSYCAMSKSDPTGRERINPFINVNHDGTVIRHESLKHITEPTQLKFNR